MTPNAVLLMKGLGEQKEQCKAEIPGLQGRWRLHADLL